MAYGTPIERVDEIFRRNVPGRIRSEGTPPDTADAGVERFHPRVNGRAGVGEQGEVGLRLGRETATPDLHALRPAIGHLGG